MAIPMTNKNDNPAPPREPASKAADRGFRLPAVRGEPLPGDMLTPAAVNALVSEASVARENRLFGPA
ncbi:MAG: hypothetical protein KJS95_09435 [Gammaproteobacteria bacterium]|nr:hypothetical protein [Gammaproteobacteria bacterium]